MEEIWTVLKYHLTNYTIVLPLRFISVEIPVQIKATTVAETKAATHEGDIHIDTHKLVATRTNATNSLPYHIPYPNVLIHAILSKMIVETFNKADVSTNTSNDCVVDNIIVRAVLTARLNL